jgi:hypothetical protein
MTFSDDFMEMIRTMLRAQLVDRDRKAAADLLRSIATKEDVRLTLEQADVIALADLLAPVKGTRKVGRRRGSYRTPRQEVLRFLITEVRNEEVEWQLKNPKLPFRGMRDKIIKNVMQRFDCFRFAITHAEIKKELDRGGSSLNPNAYKKLC